MRIDLELGLLRIAQFASAVDRGRILYAKTARSQTIGANVMGIRMSTLEETGFESASGRIANPTLSTA